MASSATSLAGVKKLTQIGWGLLEGGEESNYLQYASLTYNKKRCMKVYNEISPSQIEKDHICIGVASNALKQSCSGDSGGPTILERSGRKPVQIAVTSYGFGDGATTCGQIKGEDINVDTSVAYWRTWIENVLSYQNLRGTTPPRRMNNLVQGKCYSGTGAALRTLKLRAGYRCCDACRENAACKAWTHDLKSKKCFLLPRKGKSVNNKTCTSGWYK